MNCKTAAIGDEITSAIGERWRKVAHNQWKCLAGISCSVPDDAAQSMYDYAKEARDAE